MTAYPEMAREFPEFDQSTLPSIPAGWEESSWHNNLCPAFRDLESGLEIWIEEADPAKREFPEDARFGITSLVSEFELPDWHFQSDNWDDILRAVRGEAPETAYYVRAWKLGRRFAEDMARGMGTEELADAVDQIDAVAWDEIPRLLQRWGVLSCAHPHVDAFGAPASEEGPGTVLTEDVAYAFRQALRYVE